MKIELVDHTLTVMDKDTKQQVTHEPGKPFDVDDKEAERLIALGFARKAGSVTPVAEPKPPATEPKKPEAGK